MARGYGERYYRGPAVPGDKPSRRNTHRILEAALDILRYQRARWTAGEHGIEWTHDPAQHAHVWRALGDDLDTVLERLTALRDTARAEQDRLSHLNGDTTTHA